MNRITRVLLAGPITSVIVLWPVVLFWETVPVWAIFYMGFLAGFLGASLETKR